jgi:DNA polymerase-3 subunit alpha
MGWDEMQAAKDLGIETGPGRGSSAGCIVAYALEITDVDPLYYGLIFERFWNSGRAKGFPDIDSDFARARRQEIITYLKQRWGHDRVQAIGTVGYMKPKSVVDKLYKGFGLDFKDAEDLKEIIGKTTKIEILGHKQIGWNPELEPGKVHYVSRDCGEEIEAWIQKDPDLRREFIEMCEICCSRVQQYGIHASGIVISDVPLADELPTYRRGGKEKGVPATMFAMSDVDDRMFIKLDVLGLRTLEALEYWRQYMAEQGVDIVWSGMDKEDHPEEMWKMLHDGFTAGIFQVEDGYGRQLCKRLLPRSLSDLSVINALNRPGPIQAGIPDQYIDRKDGVEPVSYADPSLEAILGPILGDTYGLFVYQEQIIAYFNAIGYTLSESDAMRKIMGKKQPQDLAAIHEGTGEWEGKSYMSLAERAGIPHDAAQSTWDTIMGFADYCFNKSHTVAYAVLSLRGLFAKYYGPAEFYAACMRSFDAADGNSSAKSDRKKKLKMAPQYVNEARRLRIPVEPPSIDKSRAYSWVDADGTWYFGFEDVLNVGKSGSYICSLRDELELDISSPEAFEEAFLAFNDAYLNERKERKKAGELMDTKEKSPKQQFNAKKIEALYEVGAWQKLSPDGRSMTQQQKMEQEYLGVILTDNSHEVLERNAEEIGMCDSYDELVLPWSEVCDDEDLTYLEYKVCGIVSNIEEKRAKKSGQAFGIVTVTSPEGEQIEFAAFSNKWKSHKFLFRPRTVGIFTLHHNPPNQWGESYTFEQGHKLT